MRETFPKLHSFAWQEGYGAFSIGVSGIDATVSHVRNQAQHHRTRTFREEFLACFVSTAWSTKTRCWI